MFIRTDDPFEDFFNYEGEQERRRKRRRQAEFDEDFDEDLCREDEEQID